MYHYAVNNDNNVKKIVIIFVGVVFTIVSNIVIFGLSLEDAEHIFSIIGSLSIGVAIAAYFYQKRRDDLLSSIDQITFFRERIITEDRELTIKLITKDPNYVISYINLSEKDLEYSKREFSENFKRQLEIFFDSSKSNDQMVDSDILDAQISLLNLLEEFSLRVIHLKTYDDPILDTVKKSFVGVLEKNAVALLFMRDIKGGKHLYNSNLRLYTFWKDKEEKMNVIKNLERYGLITKDQRGEIYRRRRIEKGF